MEVQNDLSVTSKTLGYSLYICDDTASMKVRFRYDMHPNNLRRKFDFLFKPCCKFWNCTHTKVGVYILL